jgi:hypothetical protein
MEAELEESLSENPWSAIATLSCDSDSEPPFLCPITGYPVKQPTKFEFVLNLNAAKALGQTISDAFQLCADEVIK